MVRESHVKSILYNIECVLDVPGDIVELGCNIGTTSLFIRKFLDICGSNKDFHVYDSFEGLPEKSNQDCSTLERQFKKGHCKTNVDVFIGNFKKYNLKLPNINKGWFKDIPDDKYPDKICFAFFDGDFYTSITDSFEKVYPKLSNKGRIIIHDYKWKVLPGVEKACDDFLRDKSETVNSIESSVGLMIKSD